MAKISLFCRQFYRQMPSSIHYTACPGCGSASIGPVLQAKDHTVSAETFPIWECRACRLRFTQDVPDAAGIGPYYQSEDYISHTNTTKGLVNRLYQLVRKRTLRVKRKLLQKETGVRQGTLLDVGSGTGAFLREMTDHGWSCTGLEPDAGARQVAANLFGVTLQESKVLFTLPAGSFQAITLWHVLEHVHELHAYLDMLKKLLAPGGRIFIAVPNYTAGDARIYREHWAAYDVPRHLYHFSPESVKQLAAKHGLQLIKMKPMWYDSFYISLLSSKYKYGRTRLLSAFVSGVRSNLGAIGRVRRCSSVIYVLGRP